MKQFVFDEPSAMRLDAFLSKKADITRSYAEKLTESGCVSVNGNSAVKSTKLRCGDVVVLDEPPPQATDVLPQNIPLDVVYEDDFLLVVNKPKGMVVHPAAGNPDGTLVNALLYRCGNSLSGINGVIRPGIVHRIDKNTSGLLIVAKTDEAHLFLSEQISSHTFTREYEAVVYGNIKADEGTVDAPIGRSKTDRKKMAVTAYNSKNAVTNYYVLNRGNGFTHIKCVLKTGRTHQIRVHMAYIGHPVAGDDVYGPKNVIKSLNGQCLHAKKIGFIHPNTKQYMEFESPLPDYFINFLKTNF